MRVIKNCCKSLVIIFFSLFILGGVLNYPAFCQTYFTDDFESGSSKWTLQTPWAITNEVSKSATHCLTDSPNNSQYGNNLNITASSTSINLSSASKPVLRFWQRYVLEDGKDFGFVEVSADLGATWTPISYTTGSKTDWEQVSIDLTAYGATKPDVRIRFRLETDAQNTYDGWYIDDVRVEESTCSIAYPFFDNLESGTSNWLSSSWRTSAPGYSGSTCLTDAPHSNYTYVQDSLTLCSTINLSSAQNPQLTFWNRRNGYYYYVDVSPDYGKPGTYTTVATYSDNQANWVQEQIDLSAYAGLSTVRIRFRAYAYYGTGWYIDDVRIEDSPYPHPVLNAPTNVTLHGATLCWQGYQGQALQVEGSGTDGDVEPQFAAFDRYEIYRDKDNANVDRFNGEKVCEISQAATTCYTDDCTTPPYVIIEPQHYYYRMYIVDTNGMYSVGSNVMKAEYTAQVPHAYPFTDDMESGSKWNWSCPWGITTEASHGGSSSWTDSPGSTYANNASTALETSINLSSASKPVLRFWQKYLLEDGKDFGYVEVSADLGATWTPISYTTGYKTDWEQVSIDLTAYGATRSDVRIRFRLETDAQNTYDGWYIDDVRVEESTCSIAYPFFDNLESGTSNWLSSSWRTSSPGYSGSTCLTDAPHPDYTYVQNSLTLCSTINLSSAQNPQLTFWNRRNGYYYYVDVSPDYGKPGTYTTVATYSDNQANWVQEQIDLSAYAGLSTVRIRFRAYAYYGTGWYIDDVQIGEPCTGNSGCDDGLFCNGSETCVNGTCVPGTDPCPNLTCDEANDKCIDSCACDVSNDGSCTPQDALCTFQKYLVVCPTACGACEDLCCDANKDGQCTPADALCRFQQYLQIHPNCFD